MASKNNIPNPFITSISIPEKLFCGRNEETRQILDLLENGNNVVLKSKRRIGKSALITHILAQREIQKKYNTFYVDIYGTKNADDFSLLFQQTLLAEKWMSKTKLKESFSTMLKGLRLSLGTYNSLTGEYSLPSIGLSPNEIPRIPLPELFEAMENSDKPCIAVFDEFQQIREYEGISMEALLRTYIQPLKNVQFIFSGSKKHMIAEMFTAENAPFYESASVYSIEKIDRGVYADFIKQQFNSQKKSITQDAVDFILDWTRCHTYYTQFLCNRVFQSVRKEASMVDVLIAADTILKEHNETFLERRNFLTAKQWNYLIAVAKEGVVTEPISSAFLQKYRIGAPSTVSRLLNSLLEKELLLETKTLEGSSYCVYNVFFSRWLERV